MFLNKVFLIGNLTANPDLKTLQNGNSVLTINVATNRSYTDKAGKKVEQAEFHRVVIFGKTAELVTKYLGKGHGIFIEGRLQTRSWEDKNGKKNYTTEIICENMQFGARPQNAAPRSQAVDEPETEAGPPEVDVKDIPF